MVKLTNIKIEEVNFTKEDTKEFKKCLSLVPNLLDLLPKSTKYIVRFELKDTNTEFANALRRTIINETPVKSLDYDPYKDTDISDPYILSDFLKKQMNLIPISQDINQEDYEIELYLENKTDEIIDVKTSDFIIKKKGKMIPVDEAMSSYITICRLRPDEYISIKNIHIVENIGRIDNGAYSNVSNIYYKIMTTPSDLDNKKGKSSMVTDPTHFTLGYSTHRNIKNPMDILKKACDTLKNRLEIILGDFKNITNKNDYYYSDLIQLETSGNIKEIQLKNESWTLANVISRYAYNLTKGNIKFITPSIIHPEKEIGVIRMVHPDFSKLIQDAIKKIIEDLNSVVKSI